MEGVCLDVDECLHNPCNIGTCTNSQGHFYQSKDPKTKRRVKTLLILDFRKKEFSFLTNHRLLDLQSPGFDTFTKVAFCYSFFCREMGGYKESLCD